MKVVKLAYYDEFHCIGPECPDSCCKHWNITLSKREYLNYKKMECSPELKEIIKNAFTRLKNNERSYASMKLKENGDCPFLGGDCLCKIQKEKGEKSLTLVCSVFPRLISKVGGDIYTLACNIDCSYVVEILMNHSEGLRVIEEEYNGSNSYINRNAVSGNNTPVDWIGYPFVWNILNAEIDILQNRKFTISERLLILGYFCQKADEYLKNNEGEKISGLANALLDNELCKTISDSLKAPQSDLQSAVKSVDILYKIKLRIDNSSIDILKKLLENIMDSIDFTTNYNFNDGEVESVNIDFTISKYEKSVNTYKQIENDRPYIIENILVNLAFTQNFKSGIWENYFTFIVFYNTLKICIPAFLKENWTDRDLACAINYVAKIVINSHVAEKGTSQDFLDNNSFDLPHAAFLIS